MAKGAIPAVEHLGLSLRFCRRLDDGVLSTRRGTLCRSRRSGLRIAQLIQDMLDFASGLTRTSRLGCQVVMESRFDGLEVALPPQARNMAAGE